jgi:hypothetical protein
MDAFEIQVYDSGVNVIGSKSLEIHTNNVAEGKKAPEYPEQIPAHHLSHLTFEFAYGMTNYWELGAYLQSVLTPDSQYKFAGAKLRSKFVIPKEVSGAFQFGLNFEISDVPKPYEPVRYGAEARPILGYNTERWIFLVNPIFEFNLSDDVESSPGFAPAAKVVFDTNRGYGIGMEYYADMGSAQQMTGISEAEQYLYVVYDMLKGPMELNIGVGQGLNSESNKTQLKCIVGFEF